METELDFAEELKDDRVPKCLAWSVEEVSDWIKELGFPQYQECFSTNLVCGRKLILVDASTLPKLGIHDFEDIKCITKSIREQLSVELPGWARSISLPPRSELGLFLEQKSQMGETKKFIFETFLEDTKDAKWQPPLSNHCQILPH